MVEGKRKEERHEGRRLEEEKHILLWMEKPTPLLSL